MALLETKIIQVNNSPEAINSSSEERGCFGWSVQNVQVTHSQDSRTYTKGLDYVTGDLTVETTTINYATITYQRDKTMSNYERVAELERVYDWSGEQIRRLVSEIDRLKHDDGKDSDRMEGCRTYAMCIMFWPYGIYLVVKRILESRKRAEEIERNQRLIEVQLEEKSRQLEEMRRQREMAIEEAASLI